MLLKVDPLAVAAFVVAVVGIWFAWVPARAQRQEEGRQQFIEARRRIGAARAEHQRRALSLHARQASTSLPGMLSDVRFVPTVPVLVDRVEVEVNRVDRAPEHWKELRARGRYLLPRAKSGRPYRRYSDAVADLARPALFTDLPCYRLVEADLSSDAPRLTVEMMSFFDGFDVAEAMAHELAQSARSRRARSLPLRHRVEDPCELSNRPALSSVSALTLRVGEGTPTFLLHRRDPSKVAIAGSHLHLAPSGVFQPSAGDPHTIERDRLPWMCLCREFAEEYLGVEEARGDAGASLSYEEDEPYASINHAYRQGHLRVWVLGLGLDPTTLCPELITAVTINAKAFDALFGQMVRENEEGQFQGARLAGGRLHGYDFDAPVIEHLQAGGHLSPAAKAGLHAAWEHRALLLS